MVEGSTVETSVKMDELLPLVTQDVEFVQSALSILPVLERSRPLMVVGMKLLQRFERTSSVEDLDMAITMMEHAVRLTPDDNPSRPERLRNLGIALQNRFERTGLMEDLDRAILMNE